MTTEQTELYRPEEQRLLYKKNNERVEISHDISNHIILSYHFNGHLMHLNYLETNPNYLNFYYHKVAYNLATVREGTQQDFSKFIHNVKALLSQNPENKLVLETLQSAEQNYIIKLKNAENARQQANKSRQQTTNATMQQLMQNRSLQDEQNKQRRAQREQQRLERAAQKEAIKQEKARWIKLAQQKTTPPVAEQIDDETTLVYGKLNGLIMCAVVDKKHPQYQVLTNDSVRPMTTEEVGAFYEHIMPYFEEQPHLYNCLANFCREFGYFQKKSLPVMSVPEAQKILSQKIIPSLLNENTNQQLNPGIFLMNKNQENTQ